MTGAEDKAYSGIGFAVARRLLMMSESTRLCLACRNRSKAHIAEDSLRKMFPNATIDIVMLNTASLASVHLAVSQIRNMYDHIDYLYLNAGMMKVTGLDWSYLWKGLFSRQVFQMFTTGEGLLIQDDEVTADGLQNVFQTNVFGHYVLVKQLEDRLGSTASNTQKKSQIVWTSSSNASRTNFIPEDIQHRTGKEPYSSSKFVIDMLSVGINNSMNSKGIYSHTVNPGLVVSNMTYSILPVWLWTILLPFFCLLRIFVPGITYNSYNGAEALVWLSRQDPGSLDPRVKYQSLCGLSGRTYVGTEKMKIFPEEGEQLMKKLDHLLEKN